MSGMWETLFGGERGQANRAQRRREAKAFAAQDRRVRQARARARRKGGSE